MSKHSFLLAGLCILLVVTLGGYAQPVLAQSPISVDYDCSDMKTATIVHWQGPYTQQIILGAQAAMDECGGKMQSAGPASIDPPAHFSIFQDIVQTRPAAIVTVAYPADLWVRVIDDTVKQGIPVSTADVASPASLQSIHAGPKEKDLGRVMAKAIAEEIGPDAKGQVVAGICIPGLDVLEVRVVGFKEILKEMSPQVEVLGPFDVTFDRAQNFQIWQELLRAYPDALAYVGFCENDLPNLVRIKESDPQAKYLIASIGINPDGLKGIKDGIAFAAVGQKPFMQGYVAMRAMVQDLATGVPVPRGWIDVGPELVTAKNVDEVMAREESLAEGYEQTKSYYQPEIDAIFQDLESAVRSFGDYIGE